MDKDNLEGFDLDLSRDNVPCSREGQPLKKVGKGDYKVGYGRPPIGSRFKKGQSGNPKGRPKHPATIAEALNREFSKMVKIRENGKEIKVPMLVAFAKSYINGSVSGKERYTLSIIRNFANLINIENNLYPKKKASDELSQMFNDVSQEKKDELVSVVREILDERYWPKKDN